MSNDGHICDDELAEAYDALDPNGNITIKWDVISWTPDGYVVNNLYPTFLLHKMINRKILPLEI